MVHGPNGALYVSDGGSGGLPILLLHSLAGNATQWSAQLAHLRAERRAVAIDLHGHGGSDAPPDGEFTIAAYARDVAAVADALALGRFVVVGHSMGASVAAAFAGGHPDRVAGLLLVDGAHARQDPSPEERTWLQRLGGDEYASLIEEFWEGILQGSRPAVHDRVVADLRATPKRTVVASFRNLIDYDPVAALRRYPGPKSLVLSPIGDGAAAPHRHLDDLPHTRVEKTGHWLHLDRPEEFRRLLDAFLDRTEPQPSTTRKTRPPEVST